MANTLVDPADLADYPGAPFTQAVVDSAVAALRGDCGWHIAPVLTETVTVDGSDTRLLFVPTLKLVSVSAVRDVTGAAPIALTGWRKSGAGMLSRAAGWPCGFDAVEVDLVHGYAETPAELLPAVAYYCQAQRNDETVSAETLLSWSKTFRSSSKTSPSLVGQVLGGFTLARVA